MTGTITHQAQVGRTFAGCQVQFDLITHGDDQYAAFFNVERNLVVKHRKVSATGNPGPWQTRIMQETSYNPDAGGRDHSYRRKWDSHNWLRLAVDSDGNLHLAGDMHNTELRYWRTSTPRDLSTLARVRPVNSMIRETSCTYPEFVCKPDGTLGWLLFRDGRSGDGNTTIYKWNGATKTYSYVNRLHNGQSTPNYFPDGTGSAYWEVFRTLDGWYHVVYDWRESGDAESNSRLCYVKTQNWVDFVNYRGEALTLPLTPYSSGAIVDAVPPGGGLINNEWLFLTIGSKVYIAYPKNGAIPGGPTSRQLWLAVLDPATGTITKRQITNEPNGIDCAGNGFPDNYIGLNGAADALLINHGLHSDGNPAYRVEVPLASLDAGPFPSDSAADLWPAAVYPTLDTFPGACGRQKADSRSKVMTNDATHRNYIASRPVSGQRAYVMSWMAGPNMFAPPSPLPNTSGYPERDIVISQVDY